VVKKNPYCISLDVKIEEVGETQNMDASFKEFCCKM
jgi:hypothetical protein